MLVDFDCYLIDEITAVGDATFQHKCDHELFYKKRDSAMIIISHDENVIKEKCESVILLNNSLGTHYIDINQAFDVYNSL